MTRFLAVVALAVACASAGAPLAAEEPAGKPSAEIAAIKADLEAARFEAVIAATTALLERTDLAGADLAAALALRAQARAGLGDLAKAEEDWRRLLVLDPGYAPDPMTTGRKALERFEKIRASVVGTVRFTLDPPDAAVTVDGRPLRIAADGTAHMAAGTRRLSVASPGFDPAQMGVDVAAGAVTPVEVRLVPNARGVVVRTEPDGVEVWLEGKLLGRTARDTTAGSAMPGAAALALDPLPLGEHVLELRKECFRTTRVSVLVNVDVLDHTPIQVAPIVLGPARAAVTFTGGTPGAEILWGGSSVAKLPTDGPVALCSGRKLLEARASGRAVWRGQVELPEEGDTDIDITPRPNAAIYGTDRWPSDLESLAAGFGTTAGLALPAGIDPATPAAWKGIPLPPDTDLAVAVVGTAPARVFVYSPWLGTVARVGEPPSRSGRPVWRRPWLGWRLADSALAGGVVVVEAIEGGPAASAGVAAGERVVAIGGKPVASVFDAGVASAGVTEGSPVEVSLAAPGAAAPRSLRIVPTATPIVGEPAGASTLERQIAAAYAAVDGSGSPDAPAALASLGLMLVREGRADRAVEILRRARFETRSGVGDGTVSYLLGRALEAAGRDAQAREAYERARDSRATAASDDGPEVAPAAADHLADLGVTSR